MIVRIVVCCGAVIGMMIMWVIAIHYLMNAESRLDHMLDELNHTLDESKKEEDVAKD